MLSSIRLITRFFLLCILGIAPLEVSAQYNVDRLVASGRVAVYYEDYILGIQYFNQALSLKPYLWEPWQLRAIAKFNLDDFRGAEIDASEAIRLNPYIVQLYDLRGITRIRQDNFQGAIEDYEKAIRLQPTVQNYWYNKAICRYELKDYDKAHLELDTIISRWSKFASPYLLKADIYLHQNDTVSAGEWIAKSLDIDPYNAEAWSARANISLSREQWKDAEEFFSKAIHLKPKKASNYLNRAVARLKVNNLRGCMADYDLTLQLEPNNFLAHYNRGLLRQQVGDDNRAIEDFDYVLSLEPDNVMALFNRATLLDRTGNLRAAIRDYSKVIDQFPNFWTGLHYRAGCYRRLGMTAKAEMDEFRILKAQMDKHLGIQPRWTRQKLAQTRKKSEVDPEKYNQIVVEDSTSAEYEYKSEYRGKVQNHRSADELQPYISLSLFSYSNALTNYHPFLRQLDVVNASLTACQLRISAVKNQLSEVEISHQFKVVDDITSQLSSATDSSLPALILARSTAYLVGQNFEDAMRDIDTYLSIDSTSALAWWQRAICGARQNDYERATTPQTSILRIKRIISDFESAEKFDPDNAYLLYCRGTFHAHCQDYQSAIQHFTKALLLDGKFAEAYYNRGLIRLKTGDKEGGISDLGKAGELGIYSAYSLIKLYNQK